MDHQKAESLFQEVVAQQLVPDTVMFSSLLDAMSRAQHWSRIEPIIDQMEKAGVHKGICVFFFFVFLDVLPHVICKPTHSLLSLSPPLMYRCNHAQSAD